MKIYLASSWRNEKYNNVLKMLREKGYEVYDFRNPRPGENGFNWSDLLPKDQPCSGSTFRSALQQEIPQKSFCSDMAALDECDVCILLLPAGKSAHLEAGWAVGANKLTIILLDDKAEPELMYLMAHCICVDEDELLTLLAVINEDLRKCRICGCTDDNACVGGCYWVEEDLCSHCVAVGE